jgi:glycosyltransferase involved in cell wall biosynthesis
MSLRIVLLIWSLSEGGAQRCLVNLANHWTARGASVTIVTVRDSQHDFYPFDRRIKRVVLAPGRTDAQGRVHASRWRMCLTLRKALQEAQADVAVGYMTGATILLALASIGAPWIAIGSERTWPESKPVGRAWNVLRRFAYGRVSAVTASTYETAQWIEANTRARVAPVIPNPVWPIARIEPFVSPEQYVPREHRMMMAAGRLCFEKGFDLLVRAFSELAGSHPDWTLAILGEGTEREPLEAEIEGRNLVGRIVLPGNVGNIEDWYRRADCYVMSSRWEGFGNTLAEALSCGTPAVSFDCPVGPRTMIRHDIDGLLVPPEDVDALTRALERIITDEDLRRALSAEAISARDRFSVEAVAEQWELLFNGFLQARSVLKTG